MSADDQVLFPLLPVKSIASKEGDNKKNRSTNSLSIRGFRQMKLLLWHRPAMAVSGLALPLYPKCSFLILFPFQ